MSVGWHHQRRHRHNLGTVENWSCYLTPAEIHRTLGLVCLGVGSQSGVQRPANERVLNCWAAVLVTKGSGWLRVGGETTDQRVVAPSLFWLLPGVPHSYGPDSARGWTESWLLFDGPAAPGYEVLGFIPTGRSLYLLRDPLPVMLALNRLADACRGNDSDVDVLAGALVHELLVVARRAVALSHTSEEEKVLAGLRAGAMTDASVGQRAAELGVSLPQLRKVVQRHAGCSPVQYIHRLRVNHAKLLLAETDLPITEVAGTVGFGDPAYFARHFRSSVGLSPREFRSQQHRSLR
jgi:AraC-like DNA-binding protein